LFAYCPFFALCCQKITTPGRAGGFFPELHLLFDYRSRRRAPLRASQDVGADVDDASVNHAESTGGSRAKIKHPAAIKWAAIIYCYDDTSACPQVGYADARAERQGLVRCRKSGAAAGVVRGHTEKCVRSGRSRLRMNWQRGRESGRQQSRCAAVHDGSPDDLGG
jgi:hypothetical protein